MPITITITDPTPEQIAALFGAPAAQTQAPAKPKATPKAKDEPPVETGKPEVAGSDAEGQPVAEVPDQAAVTAAAQAYVKANGRDALVELLGKYGASNLSGVPEDKRADFIAATA